MTIPYDIEKRWWVEVSNANPNLVDSFSNAIVAFLAFDKNKVPQVVGTGFVVAAESESNSEYSFVLSAKHVFTEGIINIQRPHPTHSPSAIFISKHDKTPSIEPKKLKVLLAGKKHASMLNVSHVCYNDCLDIASCIVRTQEGESLSEQLSIPLDIDVPPVGEVVHMVGMEDMSVKEHVPPNNIDGLGQVLSIFRRISIRIGVVTEVYPKGLRHYRWPCFTTSIPAKPGMSGGFVYWAREGVTVAACGVVCADNSTEEAHKDFHKRGESIIGSAWPALSLRLPQSIPHQPDESTLTIFEMMSRGFFT